MKIHTGFRVLLWGTLLLILKLSRPADSVPSPPVSSNISATTAASSTHPDPIYKENTSEETSPAPLHNNAAALTLNNTTLVVGERLEHVISKLGQPGRIVETEYDFEYYVYNYNYRNLSFIAVKDSQVVGFYTDSLSFYYLGITPDSDVNEVNQRLNSDYKLSTIINIEDDHVIAKLLMDQEGTGKVSGIYVLSKQVKEDGFRESVMRSIELLTYDLTNSIRARNNVPLLSWSSSAAKASRKHSLDMAEKHYFSHISPDRKRPGDRLYEEGLSYQSIGENIIAGYGTAILSCHAWFNSPEHRNNLLNPDYISLGVGFVYQEGSEYGTYITQDFYR